MFPIVHLLVFALTGASLAAAQTHVGPKLTYAYTVTSGTMTPYTIATPFGNDTYYFINNNTIAGPLINATTDQNQGVGTFQVTPVAQNSTAFLFKAQSTGTTSDGVRFWVEDDGIATGGNPSRTFDQQTWHIGGRYANFSISKFWCYGAEDPKNGAITNDCYIVS